MILFSAMILSGCSLLDMTIDGRETLSEIFADHDKTAAYLNTCYSKIPTKSTSYSWVCNAPTALSDEGWTFNTRADGVAPAMYSGSASASFHPLRDYGNTNYYADYMLQIRECNTFLHYIGSARVNTEQERNRWRAEALTLRAYYMSEMMKWFGAFAFDPEGFADDFDYSTLVKPSVWEIAQQIDKDCTEAIACEDLPWRIDNKIECMRMTKAIAWCLKSKAYLFAASPVHSEQFDDVEIAEHWDVAYQVNKKAVEQLEAHGYALKTAIADPRRYQGKAAAYQELFTSISLTTADDPETIWHGYTNQNYVFHNYIGSKVWGSVRAGLTPSQEMVDAYEVLSEDGTKSEPLLNLESPYYVDKSPNYNFKALALGYEPNDPYKARRDPRMSVCIVRNGDRIFWHGEEVEIQTYVGGDHSVADAMNEDRLTRTGYYWRKYVGPVSDDEQNQESAPWKYFRLAEIKLNYAEAAANAGHLDEAKAQVDQIRDRVGMPAIPASLSQDAMIARVHNERMVELCYEECRYFDLRRWAQTFRSDKGYKEFNSRCHNLTAMWITKDPATGVLRYERKANLVNNSTNVRDVLLPIPEDEANTLYALTLKKWQNYGW